MAEQVVTVTLIGQRRAAIDIGCGGEVGRHAKPDDRHGFPNHASGCGISTIRK
jgi:hypothetical protein